MASANSYTIGTDPEFAMLDTHDQVVTFTGPNGKLGWDHGGRVVEIRTDPSLNVSDLLADIERTLNRRELVPYRPHKWKAGGIAGPETLGGHIHFDVPYGANPLQTAAQIQAADLMTRWLEHIEILPKGESEIRRSAGHYGRFGDVRPAGRRADGFPRLEYRTPASWLYSPRSAQMVLTALKLALIDPEHTLNALLDMTTTPVTKLRRFIRGFARRDDDAQSLLAAMRTDRNRIAQFRGDPNADIKSTWHILAPEAATVEAPQPRPIGQTLEDRAREIDHHVQLVLAQLVRHAQAYRMGQARLNAMYHPPEGGPPRPLDPAPEPTAPQTRPDLIQQ